MKVVAHLREGKLIKGYADAVPAASLQALLHQDPEALPQEIGVRLVDSNNLISVPLGSLKALFFVKSFEGRAQYKEIKFFNTHPPVEGLWVRVKFFDGESFEGVLHNSIHYLIYPGFFLRPPDPQSNNEAVYVVKASLVEFRVLGLEMNF